MVASAKLDKPKPPVFHPNELARGWRILRQHVKIHVDLERRSISGTAIFNLCALNTQCVTFALNLRRCHVRACHVNGRPAAFRLVSPLDDEELVEAVSSESGRHRIRDVEHTVKLRDEAASMQGELVVDIPAVVSCDVVCDLDTAYEKVAKSSSAPDVDNDASTPPALPLDQLPTLKLSVEYDVLDPTAGAIFYGDKNAQCAPIDPVYMLTDSRCGMARFWMPCLDTLVWCDRYLFDFDIAVKSNLMVVASGELIETRLHSGGGIAKFQTNDPIKVFKYRLLAPAHPSEVVLAVGPFVVLPDPVLANTVTHFCLPGRAKELVHTCPPLFAKAVAFCRDYFGSDPPTSSFKHVFVGSMGRRADTTVTGAGGVVVYSGDLLHTERCIDESLVAREAIMSGMVMSYFGRFLRPRSTEDDWLIRGLAAHVSTLGLQAILGRNWYRFRILDEMDELKRGVSYDLSNIKTDGISDAALRSVKRRSHIIVYMIEKRIGSDVVKRALRDIVVEGRSSTVALLKMLDRTLEKPIVATDDQREEVVPKLTPQPSRILKDLTGSDPEQGGSTGVISSGFDEAIQGVSVGPFLKRLRAICGTDVRSLVRQWASSRGIPRIQLGYVYNPRKHCLDFALKQEGLHFDPSYTGGKGLSFSGILHIKVMETEGSSEHSVEVREDMSLFEVPCHSRRAKHKSAAQAEKEFNENPARAVPVLWVRVDPENEWCMEATFKQHEDAWTALLNGERDAVAQFEACRGLADCRSEASAKALLAQLEDDQLFWRVRAEAASILAKREGGFEMLQCYFRSCYTDGNGHATGLPRPNDFSNLANYFVKRAIVCAMSEVRVPGLRTALSLGDSVPVKAAMFLSQLLAANDNTGNEFDDDHYVVDLVNACGKIGALCVGDFRHSKAADDGRSTSESITLLLERYRSLEKYIPSRNGLIATAVTGALCDIEAAKMALANNRDGRNFSKSILSGQFSFSIGILGRIQELLNRRHGEDSRLGAISSLAKLYSGKAEFALWLLSKCDRDSCGGNILETYRVNMKAVSRFPTEWGFVESPSFRYRVLDALSDAAVSKQWLKESSPLLLLLRRPTAGAKEFCRRVLQLSVNDPHARVRFSALQFAKVVWGAAVPVCMQARVEYAEAKRHQQQIVPKEIVPMKTTGSLVRQQRNDVLRTVKLAKPKVPKSSKNGKSSKGNKRKISIPSSVVQVNPPEQQHNGTEKSPIQLDGMEPWSEGRIDMQSRPAVESNRPLFSGLKSKPVAPTIRLPRSEPLGVPRSAAVKAPTEVTQSRIEMPVLKLPSGIPRSGQDTRTGTITVPKSVPERVGPRIPFSIPKSQPRSVTKPPTSKAPASKVPVSKVPVSKVPASKMPFSKLPPPKPPSSSTPKSGLRSLPSPTPLRSTPISVPKGIAKGIPRSEPVRPRNAVLKIPKSLPVQPCYDNCQLPWHPLDREDSKMMEKEYINMKADRARRREEKRREGLARTGEFESTNGSASHAANGTDSERKKKKKKKKRRHQEGEDETHRKKKKKRKHKEEGERQEREPDFEDERRQEGRRVVNGGDGASTEKRKIGKVKIKYSSFAPPAESEAAAETGLERTT